ncbi:MAG: phage tail tape measure protein, partial [Chloroflexi bacterium]|nr:phage tail tape measure protein [Chloroflexota bacterium]
MATVVSTMLARLRLDKSQYDRGLKEAIDGGNRLGASIRSIGKAAVFGAVAAGATATAASIVKSVGAAQRYEKQMANVNTLLRLNESDQANLNSRLLEFTAGTTSRLDDVSTAYYDIASGIADTSKHMAVLTAAENAATAGFADLRSTTSALVGVMNAYNLEANQAGDVSDILINTVRNGVLTMDELAGVLPQVSGLAAATGVSMADLAGAIGGITKTGVKASEAGTQLRALITSMIKPSTDLQGVIEQLGYESGEALLADRGLLGAVNAIKDASGDNFTQMFTNVRALTGALNLSAPAAQGAHDAIQDYTGAVDAAIAATGNTLALDAMRSKIDVLSVGFGSLLTPALRAVVARGINPMLDSMIGLLGFFGALPTEGRKFANVLQNINLYAQATGAFVGSMLEGIRSAFVDLFRGDIGAQEFFMRISFATNAATSAARGKISDFVAWLSGTAFARSLGDLPLISSIGSRTSSALEGARQLIANLAASINQVFNNAADLPLIDKLKAFANTDFSGVLQEARAFIGDFTLDNLALDLSATRERIAEALRNFVSGIRLPAIDTVMVDFAAIRDRISSSLAGLLNSIALPGLPPLSFDLLAIR